MFEVVASTFAEIESVPFVGPREYVGTDTLETEAGGVTVDNYARTINGTRYEFSVLTVKHNGVTRTELAAWAPEQWEHSGIPLHLWS